MADTGDNNVVSCKIFNYYEQEINVKYLENTTFISKRQLGNSLSGKAEPDIEPDIERLVIIRCGLKYRQLKNTTSKNEILTNAEFSEQFEDFGVLYKVTQVFRFTEKEKNSRLAVPVLVSLFAFIILAIGIQLARRSWKFILYKLAWPIAWGCQL